jgi:hypothetical protein
MNDKIATTDLPAPLSLTLDQVTDVAGGVSLASVASIYVPHWLWFGKPPVVSLTGIQTVSLP